MDVGLCALRKVMLGVRFCAVQRRPAQSPFFRFPFCCTACIRFISSIQVCLMSSPRSDGSRSYNHQLSSQPHPVPHPMPIQRQYVGMQTYACPLGLLRTWYNITQVFHFDVRVHWQYFVHACALDFSSLFTFRLVLQISFYLLRFVVSFIR